MYTLSDKQPRLIGATQSTGGTSRRPGICCSACKVVSNLTEDSGAI